MAEGITLKRIIDMDEATELSSSDYALVDSATGGPKKFALGDELYHLKEDYHDIDDRVTTLEEGGGSGSGLTEDIKAALLQMARKVAYIDADGQDYYDDLYDALYTVTAISVNPTTVTLQTIGGTQQLTATTTPSGAGVSWASSNTAVATVNANGLVASVGYGSATITATAGQLSATCAVVVAQATLTSISAVYTQSGTVYDSDSLDSLKDDLVVTAHWSNGTTSTVASADYTLSGTLTVGTSTVTVSYSGKTTTFTVTVSESYVSDGLYAYWDAIDNTGSTHDASATTWVDKINGYTWQAMKTDSTKTWAWDTDGLVFSPETTGSPGITQGKNTFQCTRPGTDLRTLEIVFSTNTADAQCLGEFTSNSSGISDSNTQIIALVSSDNTFITQGSQSSSFSAGSLSNIKSITATYNASKVPQKAYMNGSEVTTRGSSHSFKYHFYNTLILGAQNNSANLVYPFKGTIHAIRMYSKELTAEEIAQNYAIDVTRFGLGV